MTACGYTPADIDAMAMHDVLGLLRHWRDHPPACEILAAVHRVEPAAHVDPDDPSGLATLIRSHPDGTVRSRETSHDR